ncbi:putative signal peptide protein [Puccinia sorghi]|uniref:Putative signal peptide protein n=1 Tax=Puccinia sorghi TaxID=27349 RepID=A0A0L6UB28_9BASI|nr:putative signal peptide protein [Puccinia sorghi]
MLAYVYFLAQSLCSLHSDCASKLASWDFLHLLQWKENPKKLVFFFLFNQNCTFFKQNSGSTYLMSKFKYKKLCQLPPGALSFMCRRITAHPAAKAHRRKFNNTPIPLLQNLAQFSINSVYERFTWKNLHWPNNLHNAHTINPYFSLFIEFLNPLKWPERKNPLAYSNSGINTPKCTHNQHNQSLKTNLFAEGRLVWGRLLPLSASMLLNYWLMGTCLGEILCSCPGEGNPVIVHRLFLLRHSGNVFRDDSGQKRIVSRASNIFNGQPEALIGCSVLSMGCSRSVRSHKWIMAFFILVEGFLCFQHDIKLSCKQVVKKELYLLQIRIKLCTNYNQHTTGINSVYDQVKRKHLLFSAMETALLELILPNEPTTNKINQCLNILVKELFFLDQGIKLKTTLFTEGRLVWGRLLPLSASMLLNYWLMGTLVWLKGKRRVFLFSTGNREGNPVIVHGFFLLRHSGNVLRVSLCKSLQDDSEQTRIVWMISRALNIFDGQPEALIGFSVLSMGCSRSSMCHGIRALIKEVFDCVKLSKGFILFYVLPGAVLCMNDIGSYYFNVKFKYKTWQNLIQNFSILALLLGHGKEQLMRDFNMIYSRIRQYGDITSGMDIHLIVPTISDCGAKNEGYIKILLLFRKGLRFGIYEKGVLNKVGVDKEGL